MSQILSKYSKTTNLSLSSIQDKNTDSSYPYSFIDWKARNYGLIPGKEFIQYTEYIKSWYNDRPNFSKNIDFVKAQYIALLNEISVVFSDDEINKSWLANIDLNDNWDLETVIPIYARKLKEIAIYLTEKRETIKLAKLKYNMVGAVQALERLFYSYLLKAFTKRNYILGVPTLSAFASLPELSAVNNGFQLSIEELYDEEEYYDKDPKFSSKKYFDIDNIKLTSFFQTFNFPTSALEWLFGTGFNYTSADNSLTWTVPTDLTTLPPSAFEDGVTNLNEYNYFALSKKYLGEKQWIGTGGYYVPITKDFTFNIQASTTNLFYWPSGEFYDEIETDVIFDSIMLSATNFTNLGTAAKEYYNSDLVFVRKNEVYEGAWLALLDYTTSSATMSALLDGASRTIFKFPWIGFGLSGDDIPWSGKSLSNMDKNFDYLPTEYKNAIIDAYWADTSSTESITPILLNNTSLIDSGATASINYSDADKIVVRITDNPDSVHDTSPDAIYNGIQKAAWLYKFKQTEIPIALGDNEILWPLARLDNLVSTVSANLPITCNSIALSTINVTTGFAGSCASKTLSASDIIYKIEAFGGDATEAAWLSGMGTYYENNVIQSGMSFKADAGKYIVFQWDGPNDTNLNDVIFHHPHHANCPYRTVPKDVVPISKDLLDFNTEIGTNRWEYCTCMSFYRSPCGHFGPAKDFSQIGDFICEDFQFPNFDPENWRFDVTLAWGASADWNATFMNSIYFGRFETTNPDINYGPGTWKNTFDGSPFLLKTAAKYRYYRTNLKRNIDQFTLPYIVVNYSFPVTSQNPIWIKAKKQGDVWISADTRTDMTLNAGDILRYTHASGASALDSSTIYNNTINFAITVPISSTPYWADKGSEVVPLNGGIQQIVDGYTLKYQPIISDIVLSNNSYIEYIRQGPTMFWYQPLEFKTAVETNRWNQLKFNNTIDLSITTIGTNLGISALDIPSDIVLEPLYGGQPVLVNYYARSPFTNTQTLTSSQFGSPPTGGLWVEPVSSVYLDPSEPFRNLTNRHFPTIATVPSIAKLQSEEDTGGYFTPKHLGVSTFLARNYTVDWNI